jgi:hypothetical protein
MPPLSEISLEQGEELEAKDTSIQSSAKLLTSLIRTTGRQIEDRHPILKNNHLGLVIWVLCIASILGVCHQFIGGNLESPVVVVLVCAFATSLLHELEHDIVSFPIAQKRTTSFAPPI